MYRSRAQAHFSYFFRFCLRFCAHIHPKSRLEAMFFDFYRILAGLGRILERFGGDFCMTFRTIIANDGFEKNELPLAREHDFSGSELLTFHENSIKNR